MYIRECTLYVGLIDGDVSDANTYTEVCEDRSAIFKTFPLKVETVF